MCSKNDKKRLHFKYPTQQENYLAESLQERDRGRTRGRHKRLNPKIRSEEKLLIEESRGRKPRFISLNLHIRITKLQWSNSVIRPLCILATEHKSDASPFL